VIAAARAHERAGEQMPGLVGTVSDTRRRVDALRRRKPALADEVTAAEGLVRHHTRRRDDAAELLRVAGLSTTIDGPVPTEDEGAIRERLASVEEALANAAVDPELHEQLQRTRRHLSNLDAQLDADPDRRRRAERFAASDGARHPIALAESVESPPSRKRMLAKSTPEPGRQPIVRKRSTSDWWRIALRIAHPRTSTGSRRPVWSPPSMTPTGSRSSSMHSLPAVRHAAVRGTPGQGGR